MSIRTGITRVCNLTFSDVVIALGAAAKTIFWFRRWWKSADAFQRYRTAQIPVEILSVAAPLGVATMEADVYPSGIIPLPMIAVGLLAAVPAVIFTLTGRNRFLKWLREKWILPIPTKIFVCVRCGHWEICHLGHPKKNCRYCKTRWKDEWADYRVVPTPIEMRIDDLYPGMHQ